MDPLSIMLAFTALVGEPSLLDLCRIAGADATTTLGADDDVDTLGSGNASYAEGLGCPRFVADFKVLPGAKPASNALGPLFQLSGGPTSTQYQSSAATCDSLRVGLRVYKKAADASAFESVASATYRGSWADATPLTLGGCSLVRSGKEAPAVAPNPAGTDTWRVAVDASIAGRLAPVTAKIAFLPPGA
jgi:hypothetical protein